MSAKIISGTEIAKEIRVEIKQEIAELKEKHGLTPGLATVLVGDDPASRVYVGQKDKSCNNLGIYSKMINLPEDIAEEDLLKLIDELNNDSSIHGILVQLPLPEHINETRVLYAIDPNKDVDGFHPVNVGKMVIGEKCFLPCTPHGVLELLSRSGVKTEGAEVVIVGRSNIVGKPVLNLMLQKRPAGNATVTLCHTRTKDISFHTKRADILIVATGHPKTVTGDMVSEGVVVIDVGVNRIGKTSEGKAILVGDVEFDSVKEKAAAITPVPGGVGPMTIVMLMKNTVEAARNKLVRK
ncbi:MAG: bifunctional methylenetetrahydrofolate dehydrogenase/methenyltetrahydrofolate cyclohydrolase FolD [Desulfobacteraceae bacterium]|nr:bifunctional methylenetetrahydrofolate dehydrogenase/methenyltetrahydrofolate cyclohydrolase FolD [Desulfobacteraceae bacterium]MBC2718467.1 bifunctional methylenetetrahydrofolate dehydrogenase/methenyltetrahydrofolate cyclohydrolase FolD [Desulfobacteraceae bacterium]